MTESTFTASQIAGALGYSRQFIHQQLAGISADAEQLVNGQRANAWSIGSLPPRLLQNLSAIAARKGNRSVAALLNAPAERYEPQIRFAEATPGARDQALKLQRALQPFIRDRNCEEARSSDFATRGVAEYRRVFGYPVSAKHWKGLFDRSIERDRGFEEWDRPEIFLQENPPRIATALPISAARQRNLEVLEDALSTVLPHGALTVERKVYLWTKVCDQLQLAIDTGAHAKKTKRAILKVCLHRGLSASTKKRSGATSTASGRGTARIAESSSTAELSAIAALSCRKTIAINSSRVHSIAAGA